MKIKISNEKYHASDALGSTGISLLLDRPSKFKSQMIDGIRETKPCYLTGNAFHCLVLEGKEFDKRYLVTNLDRRCKTFKELTTANPEKKVLKQDEFNMIRAMRDSINQNSTIRNLLAKVSETEPSVFWTDTATGVHCKCRPDAIVNFDGRLIIVDLKTTKDASQNGFAKAVAQFGYHRQAAWYSHGMEVETGKKVDLFAFVAVEKSPPYDCAIYNLTYEALATGRKECKKAIGIYNHCKKTNTWAGLPEGITELSLPEWYIYSHRCDS